MNTSDVEITVENTQALSGWSPLKPLVRVKHVPTGIEAFSVNKRSQHSNQKEAMRLLKEKLLAHEDKQFSIDFPNAVFRTTPPNLGYTESGWCVNIKDSQTNYEVTSNEFETIALAESDARKSFRELVRKPVKESKDILIIWVAASKGMTIHFRTEASAREFANSVCRVNSTGTTSAFVVYPITVFN